MGDPGVPKLAVQPAWDRRLSEDYAARVADDGDPLRSFLRAARAWGIPPSLFLGEKRVTTYTYNTAGQLARTEVAEWTQRDFDMAMALQDYEGSLCGGCHTPLSETTNPENEGRYRGRIASVCHKCVALDVAADNNNKHPGALLYTAEIPEP